MKTFVVSVGAAEKPYHFEIKADYFDDTTPNYVFFSGKSPDHNSVAQFAQSAVIAIIDKEALVSAGVIKAER